MVGLFVGRLGCPLGGWLVGCIYTPWCVVSCAVAWCEMFCPWGYMYVQPLQGWCVGGLYGINVLVLVVFQRTVLAAFQRRSSDADLSLERR